MLQFEVVKQTELVPDHLDIEVTKRIRDVGSLGARETIDRFCAMYRHGEKVPPIKVLAERPRERGGAPTHSLIVIDGGLRVIAARLEGIEKIAVDVVMPHPSDVSLDIMFLACNLRHGLPLSDAQRDRVIRALALQYKDEHKDEPRMGLRQKFTHGLSKMIGLAPSTIESIVVGIFGRRTETEREEDDRAIAAGAKPRDVAKKRGISRQAVEKRERARKGKERPVQRQAQRNAEILAAAHNGDAPPAVLPREEEQVTLRDLDFAMSKISDGLHTVCNQIALWILPNAARYSPEVLRALWGRVDQFSGVLLRLGVAAGAYADPKVAERDLESLGKAYEQARAAVRQRTPALLAPVGSNGEAKVKIGA